MRVVLYQPSMYPNTQCFASARVAKSCPWVSSTFSECQKLSIGALSKQLPVRGELMVTPRSVSGKGRGNAAATRKNQAEHYGEGAYQSAPPEFCRRGTDERDFRCNRS